jgi:putative ABC transport system permease protein
MRVFLQDLHYSLRVITHRLGFTIVIVLTLALGIGANTAIFSVLYSVSLQPLPYQEPEHLVMLWRGNRKDMKRTSLTSPALYRDWRDKNQVFDDLAAYEDSQISNSPKFDLTGVDQPSRALGARVTTNLLSVLGVKPALGRDFTTEEGKEGNDNVVLLSDHLWRSRFNAAADIVGKTVYLNNRSYTVIGVLPHKFKLSYPKGVDLLVPLPFSNEDLNDRSRISYKVIARLKPGVTLNKARPAMDMLSYTLEQQYPKTDRDGNVVIIPIHEVLFGKTRFPLLILFVAVGLVLIIACINAVILLLMRATERSKEIAVRVTYGATRGRIIRQLLTESILLSLTSGGVGLLLSLWSRSLLESLIPESLPRFDELAINNLVLVFTLLLSLSSGVLSGLVPAIHASKSDLIEALKEGALSATSSLRLRRARGVLVIIEMALTLFLLIGAGLMIQSLWRLRTLSLGFNGENVVTMQFTMQPYRYGENEVQKLAIVRQILTRIRALPGVISASTTTAVPSRDEGYVYSFDIEGRPKSTSHSLSSQLHTVDAEYFRTMEIQLLRGRFFTDQDSETARNVAVISQTMARLYFPNEDPLGKRLVIGPLRSSQDVPVEIVGVVSDVQQRGLGKPIDPAIYIPLPQNRIYRVNMVVRVLTKPTSLISALLHEIHAIDSNQPVEMTSSMEQIISGSVSDRNFYAVLLCTFAALALILGVTGIYSVMSYTVAQRTREIGLRMALGASTGNVLKLVIGQGMKLAIVGVAIGLIASFTFTRLLQSLLFGISAIDPMTFAIISLLLIAVALLACYLPARRATKVDPLMALRNE